MKTHPKVRPYSYYTIVALLRQYKVIGFINIFLLKYPTRHESVLARILPFFCTDTYSTLFRYSPILFLRYSHGFYLFPILAQILPFFGTHTYYTIFRYSPGSTIFTYSHGFYPISLFAQTVFRFLHGFYLYPVLSCILLFFGTYTDSTLFRYLLG